MTLFRKVFQNQSRPADTPEDDALRDALRQAEEADSTPGPDPFVLSDQVDEVTLSAEDIEAVEEDPVAEEDVPTVPVDAAAGEDAGTVTDEEVAGETVAAEDDFVAPDGEESGNDLVEGILAAARDESSRYAGDVPAAAPHAGSVDEASEAAAVEHDDAGKPEAHEDDAFAEMDPYDEPAAEVMPEGPVEAPLRAEATPPEAVVEEEFPSPETEEDTPAKQAAPEEEEIDLSAFAREQLTAFDGQTASSPSAEVPPADAGPVPAPAAGRAGRRAGRVKTRLLGFNRGGTDHADPIGGALEATASQQQEKFPVGWLVVVEGPGVGHSFSIFTGASMIGRGEDQVIRLDFGDNSISRQNHAAIAYDEEQNKFYIGHGGKSNIIRRNARPVLSTEELQHADLIRIGETTLRFVALCGSDFKWDAVDTGNDAAV